MNLSRGCVAHSARVTSPVATKIFRFIADVGSAWLRTMRFIVPFLLAASFVEQMQTRMRWIRSRIPKASHLIRRSRLKWLHVRLFPSGDIRDAQRVSALINIGERTSVGCLNLIKRETSIYPDLRFAHYCAHARVISSMSIYRATIDKKSLFFFRTFILGWIGGHRNSTNIRSSGDTLGSVLVVHHTDYFGTIKLHRWFIWRPIAGRNNRKRTNFAVTKWRVPIDRQWSLCYGASDCFHAILGIMSGHERDFKRRE